MDLRMMGLTKAEIAKAKDAIADLKREKEVTVTRPHPLLEQRNAATYGRLYLPGALSSYEYYLAVFGAPAPVAEGRLVFAEPLDGCSDYVTYFGGSRQPKVSWWRRLWRRWRWGDAGGGGGGGGDGGGALEDGRPTFVVVYRGKCSFADKARNVGAAETSTGAAAMVIVNADEELFRVAAVIAKSRAPAPAAAQDAAGALKPATTEAVGAAAADAAAAAAAASAAGGVEAEAGVPEGLAVAMVRASAGPQLAAAVAWGGGQVQARLVPLECESKIAECNPILPEESLMTLQVRGGNMAAALTADALAGRGADAADAAAAAAVIVEVDFVSARFGTTLPPQPVRLVWPERADGCPPMAAPVSEEGGGGGVGRAAERDLAAAEAVVVAALAAGEVAGVAGAAVVVRRGGCSFGNKAAAAQASGARAVVIVDDGGEPLQPIGASDAQAKSLYIPAVFVTREAGERLQAVAAAAAAAVADAAGGGGAGGGGERSSGGGGTVWVAFQPDDAVAVAWEALTAAHVEGEAARQAAVEAALGSVGKSECQAAWARREAATLLQGAGSAGGVVDAKDEL
ncbi:unnamed protein product [Phaeothamnion confervicola]